MKRKWLKNNNYTKKKKVKGRYMELEWGEKGLKKFPYAPLKSKFFWDIPFPLEAET